MVVLPEVCVQAAPVVFKPSACTEKGENRGAAPAASPFGGGSDYCLCGYERFDARETGKSCEVAFDTVASSCKAEKAELPKIKPQTKGINQNLGRDNAV